MERDFVADVLAGFVEMAPWLWWLSITFYGIGDFMTTGAAAMFTPVVEGGPVVGWSLRNHGIAGLAGVKAVAFGIAYGTWLTVRHPYNVGVPLALAVLGVGLTTWNLFVLAFVASG